MPELGVPSAQAIERSYSLNNANKKNFIINNLKINIEL